ncbi:MAG TPA: Xaa-Pro peptidase family protein, partial [Kiloniellaceae bacterium]|nr:Xaa-Pro peptidase family protein [Kiloniellaceae bacterium]
RHRQTRLRRLLAADDLAGILIMDPVNLRYATGTRNMQVWTMHNFVRYGVIATEGPRVLFEVGPAQHLAAGLVGLDEVRPSLSADYFVAGPRATEMARLWAGEIAAIVRGAGGGNRRLAVDRLDLPTAEALTREGLLLVDGKKHLELARSIKSLEEIRAFKDSLESCEAAIAELRSALVPGMRECEALALLIKGSIARGGEYPETRLLTSGPRTNPWFQETGDRVMEAGDLLSFDSDLIGPRGFYNDISRCWLVGDGKPSDEQRRIYDLARRQLTHNIALLRPGEALLAFAEKAFALPEPYLANRYADVGHGCGLGVEYPFLWYPEDAAYGAYDGLLEENMIVCIESYVGAQGGREGVKLEQPVWITAQGPVVLAESPLEDSFA